MVGGVPGGARRRRRQPDSPDQADVPGGHPEDAPGDPEQIARTICLRMLTGAPRTRAQLADALVRRDVPDDVIERVLDRFTDVGLIDDAMFAQMWVNSRHTGRGLARRALGQELRQRGVDGQVAAEAVAGLDAETERETAHRLVRRRLPSMTRHPAEVVTRRLVGMLARKGYPSGVAYAVVRDELAAAGRATVSDEIADEGPFDD